jgi:hypothetical protein
VALSLPLSFTHIFFALCDLQIEHEKLCRQTNTKGVEAFSPGLLRRALASWSYPGCCSNNDAREPHAWQGSVVSRCAAPSDACCLSRAWQGGHLATKEAGIAWGSPACFRNVPRVAQTRRGSLGQPWAQCLNTFGVGASTQVEETDLLSAGYNF